MTDADDEMSPSDRILMEALAEALGGPQPSSALVARCEGLLTWLDVDSELAALLDQPVAEAAGTRGSPSSTALEFAVDDGSLVIELMPSENMLRGQILGGDVRELVVRTVGGAGQSLSVDEVGNFSLDQPLSGTIRLELELVSENRRIHTDWFVV